jgi:hypothetical protein
MNPYNQKSPEGVATNRATWQSIEIEVRFERNWLGSPPSDYHPSHLEIESIEPPHAQLPITETGYRSHFLSPDEIQAAGGVLAYVIDALDEAAKRKEWKARQAAQRELTLFRGEAILQNGAYATPKYYRLAFRSFSIA